MLLLDTGLDKRGDMVADLFPFGAPPVLPGFLWDNLGKVLKQKILSFSKWFISMVTTVSPLSMVVGPLPNGLCLHGL